MTSKRPTAEHSKKTTTDTFKGLIKRDMFQEICIKHVDMNEVGEIIGFMKVVGDVGKRLAGKKNETEVVQYVRNRIKSMLKQGIRVPVFTDIPIGVRGAKKKSPAQENKLIEKSLKAKGWSDEKILMYLARAKMETSDITNKPKRKTRRSYRKDSKEEKQTSMLGDE